ncbi:uncharacterized protein LOC108087788 [Drosophila ficusphila]|uniref:uncharacterized protein LOC108087788 n=1 Tax=Drosophila ficusphila TaxID=30025 RepID=UPI001C89C0E1|nr:uncharacterized protein LOC108087788 [Drosophila ficusphila]
MYIFFLFELKWGVFIIGCIDMILSIFCGWWLPWIPRRAEDDFYLMTAPSTQKWWRETYIETYYNRFGYTMYVFLLVVLVLHVGSCILLLVSAIWEAKEWAAPYLATAIMRFVVLLLILCWIVSKSYDCTTSYWFIGLSLFTFPYFWLTVVSWYNPFE